MSQVAEPIGMEQMLAAREARAQREARAGALWSAYWQERSDANRNALMEHYFPLVRFAAGRMVARARRMADVDDLIQYGAFGLKDAIASFDAARGVKFETYCGMRIRGAMLDGIKAQQWLPREARQKITRISESAQEFLMETGQHPDEERLSARIGVCADAVRTLQADAARANFVSLFSNCVDQESGRATEHAERLVDYREEQPAEFLQREDVKQLFLRELTRQQRHLLMLYYYEEMTMREIGETLGISGTRVSQMHTQIIERLRQKLGARLETASRRGSVAEEL